MNFLTSNARIEQTDVPGIWQTIDNQLYKDVDGSIYLVPRYYKTDNYTIPDWLAWLGGNKSKWDVRPSHFHDFGCQFHALIKVCMNEQTLRTKRLLRVKDDKIVCENIPIKFLKVEKKNKWFIDCMFKRMMKVANRLAKRCKAKCIITGESVGQVASQTIANMTVTEYSAQFPL